MATRGCGRRVPPQRTEPLRVGPRARVAARRVDARLVSSELARLPEEAAERLLHERILPLVSPYDYDRSPLRERGGVVLESRERRSGAHGAGFAS